MNCVSLKSVAGILVVLLAHQASAQGTGIVVKCQADFSIFGTKVIAVEITKETQGMMQARVNGELSNQNVRLDEYPIRQDLNLRMKPSSREFGSLNPGETSLTHIQGLLDDKEVRPHIRIPFDLKRVRKVKIYDLQGRQDKYGGTVLMEAYNEEGKRLGRVLRAVFANGCYRSKTE